MRITSVLLALVLAALISVAPPHRHAAAAPCHAAPSQAHTSHARTSDPRASHGGPANVAATPAAGPDHAAHARCPDADPEAPTGTAPACCVAGACPSLASPPPPLARGPQPSPGAILRGAHPPLPELAGIEVPPSLPPPRPAA